MELSSKTRFSKTVSAALLSLSFLVAVSFAAAAAEFAVGERGNIVVFGDSITTQDFGVLALDQ